MVLTLQRVHVNYSIALVAKTTNLSQNAKKCCFCGWVGLLVEQVTFFFQDFLIPVEMCPQDDSLHP